MNKIIIIFSILAIALALVVAFDYDPSGQSHAPQLNADGTVADILKQSREYKEKRAQRQAQIKENREKEQQRYTASSSQLDGKTLEDRKTVANKKAADAAAQVIETARKNAEFSGDYQQQWASIENNPALKREGDRIVVKDSLPPVLAKFKQKLDSMTLGIADELNNEEGERLLAKEDEMQQLIEESDTLIAELQAEHPIDQAEVEASLKGLPADEDLRISELMREFDKVEADMQEIQLLP